MINVEPNRARGEKFMIINLKCNKLLLELCKKNYEK